MYYRLKNFCRLVKGAARGAIYNLEDGNVYSLNTGSIKLLEACANYPLEQLLNVRIIDQNPPLDFLHKLTEMGLGAFYLQEPDRSGQQLAQSEPERINFLWLELTSNCNNTCLHCYATSGPCMHNDCVPHERWLSLIGEARQAGASAIQLIGGEPLLYPKWRELVIKASEEGFGLIQIFTNATLIDDSCLEFFWQNNVSIITTICGGTAEVHDSVTLNPGSFDKTVAAIEKLKAVGIPVRIAVIIMKANEHDIENIQKLCITLDCETAVDIVRPTGRGDDAGLVPTSYRKPLIRPPFFTNEYSFTRAHYYHNCLAGKLAVTASGDVIPCIFARRQVCGNILTAPLAEILQNQPLQACWRTTKDQIAKCKDCEYRYACFDCRPLAQCGDSRNCWLACHVGCAYNPYTGEWQDDPSQPGK